MDQRCPECGSDLSQGGVTYLLSKRQKIFSNFIDKMPIICNKCDAHLELNHNKPYEHYRLFVIFIISNFFIYSNKVFDIFQAFFLIMIVATLFITLSHFLFSHKLKDWPIYKSFEVKQTKSEILGAYLGNFINYLMLLFFLAIVLYMVWRVFHINT